MNYQTWNTNTDSGIANTNKQVNDENTKKICGVQNRELTAKNDCQGKHKQLKNVNSTPTDQGNAVFLVENDDKYDLELKFKPKHRQRIADAKNNKTFQL